MVHNIKLTCFLNTLILIDKIGIQYAIIWIININNMANKSVQNQEEIYILQYNQMKGAREGRLAARNWNKEESTRILEMQSQRGVELPGKYLVAVVQDNKIVKWLPSKMIDMRSTAVNEQQTESKVQKWSLQHKKNMVSQFGTSKSKRKLNQMMNNIIQ